jgi:hypothetical protein
MNSGDTLYYSEDNEGEGEEQRGGNEPRDGGNAVGWSLSTVHVAEQWRTQKTVKEKGKSNTTVGTKRPVVKGRCSPLMDDDPFFSLSFCSFPSRLLSTKINRVETFHCKKYVEIAFPKLSFERI